MDETDSLYQQRRKKLEDIAALGYEAYPRKFEFTHTIPQIAAEFSHRSAEELEVHRIPVRIAGRMMTVRPHGKAGFAHLAGGGAKLQVYIRLDAVGERDFALFKLLDLGDVIGVDGYLFRTRTGELTVHAEHVHFLAKALLPLPEKWHGLTDVEIRYRQRYVDLMVNPEVRVVFERRSKIVRAIRQFLDAEGYLEVETPMMQPLAGGAMARPFVTHHNTLDIDLFLRIAPELYLKRLTVGWLDRVYEINRNFRNEGISTQHNPEFTMLEFYQAYADYHDMMALTERLLQHVALEVLGSLEFDYVEERISFAEFHRYTMREALVKFWPELAGPGPKLEDLADPRAVFHWVDEFNKSVGYLTARPNPLLGHEVAAPAGAGEKQIELPPDTAPGEALLILFERVAENDDVVGLGDIRVAPPIVANDHAAKVGLGRGIVACQILAIGRLQSRQQFAAPAPDLENARPGSAMVLYSVDDGGEMLSYGGRGYRLIVVGFGKLHLAGFQNADMAAATAQEIRRVDAREGDGIGATPRKNALQAGHAVRGENRPGFFGADIAKH